MATRTHIRKKDFDISVRPQDDFFQYAGGGWIKRNPIPPTESKWGAFYVLRDQSIKRIHTILKNIASKKRFKKGSEHQMIRDFYLSGMDTKTRNKRGTDSIKKTLEKIEAIDSREALFEFVFSQHAVGSYYLWHPFVGQDDKNGEKYIFHIAQGGLTLPDRDYYLKNDAQSKKIRDAFISHSTTLLTLSGKNKKESLKIAKENLALETSLAKISMSRVDCRDIEKVYNKKKVAELKKLAPDIPWGDYLKVLKVNNEVRSLLVLHPQFFSGLSTLLSKKPVAVWKQHLYLGLLNDAAPFLSKPFVEASFSFFRKTLSGEEKMRPLWKRTSAVLDEYMGHAIGKEYVKEYFPPKAKKVIDELVKDIFAAYKQRIIDLSWMSEKTKKRALEKLSLMTKKVGYPEKWFSYRGLVIRPDDYYANVMRTHAFFHKKNMARLGKKVDRKEWFISPQTVNAFYDPNMNQIVFPAGILQPPFFDPNGDAAINYGAMGSVIGHELTHGFDDSGAKFDGKGNFKNWWTKEDKKQFEKRAQVLVKQFNTFPVGDLFVNGKLTLGENIADLGGLVIAYDAFQKYLEKNGRQTIHGFTPEQRFFIGLVLFETAHARKEYERMMVMVDPHSPAKYRVNGPFSNLETFYKAWNVTSRDKLYRAPKDRAKIW